MVIIFAKKSKFLYSQDVLFANMLTFTGLKLIITFRI